MPMLGLNQEPDYEGVATIRSTAATQEDKDFATQYNTGLDRAPGEGVAALVGGSLVDLVDTVGASVGLSEREGVNRAVLGAFGSPGLTGFYERNKGAMELGSGIVGAVASDYLAKKLLKPAGMAMQAIRGVPFAKNIATLDAKYEAARRLTQLTQTEVATRGLMGTDRFLGANLTIPYMGSLTTSHGAATKAFYRFGAAKTLTQNVATEAIMAVTLNENAMLYDDDLMHNLSWGALGLGLGQGVETLVATHQLRKIASSDKIRRINARLTDVSGLEESRLNSYSKVNTALSDAGMGDNRLGFMFSGSGSFFDNTTSYAINAAENMRVRGFDERETALFGSRSKSNAPMMDIAHNEAQKGTVRGIRMIGDSGFTMDAKGSGSVIKEGLDREPTFMMGVEEIGVRPQGMTYDSVHTKRTTELGKLQSEVHEILERGTILKPTPGKKKKTLQPLTKEEREAFEFTRMDLLNTNSRVPMIITHPGEMAPLSLGKMLDGYEPRDILRESDAGKQIFQIKRSEEFKTRIGIADDGELYLPNTAASIEDLSPHESIHMFHVGKAMSKHFAKVGMTFTLPKNPNWFQLDLAEQIAKESKSSNAVDWGIDYTRETAAVEAFAQKVDGLQKRLKRETLAQRRGVDALPDPDDLYRLKMQFNLPLVDSFTANRMQFSEEPLDLLLMGFKGGDEVRKASHQELLQVFNEARAIKGLTEETVDSVRGFSGRQFDFMTDYDGNPMAAMVAYKRPMAPFEWSRDHLDMRQVLKDNHTLNKLTGAEAHPAIREATDLLVNDPSFRESRKVTDLADDQHRSFIPGARHAAPQTTTAELVDALTAKSRRDADMPVMTAATAQQELKTKRMQRLAQEVFERNGMPDAITAITSTRNARSLMLLNQFSSFRGGWDILEAPGTAKLPTGEDAMRFVLDHNSEANKAKFQKQFGKELTKGQSLLNPQGKPIVLDALAMDVLKKMQWTYDEILGMKNTLLRSIGSQEIRQLPWYVSPTNLKGKYVAFTFDHNREIVNNMTAIGDSPEHLTKVKAEIMKSDQWKQGYTISSRDEIEAYLSLFDKNQMDFADPSRTAFQAGKVSKGTSQGNLINENAFSEAILHMRDNIFRTGDDLLEILHDDVIKANRVRASMATPEQAVGAKDASKAGSIYDRHLQNLLGISSLNAKNTFFGNFQREMVKKIDGLLDSPVGRAPGAIAARGANVMKAFAEWDRSAAPGRSLDGKKFDKFAQELGEFMPYKNVSQMIERQTNAKMPPEVAAISGKLSWFESAMRLRWGESQHAVATMGSIVANMPSVIRALQPKAGETAAEAAARNHSIAMTIDLPDGRGINVPNIPKLMYDSMRDMMGRPVKGTDLEDLANFTHQSTRDGMMNQEVAELNDAWNLVDSRAGFDGFFFGSKSVDYGSKTGFGIRNKIAHTGGIDKWLGVLSDSSENWARQWGMYAGRRVALANGITDIHTQKWMAHEITNKIIADYNPRNRAQVFQGPLGSLAGLFQTYSLGYYQRMFRYIETQDMRSLAIQQAVQSSVFGVGSTPGWQAFNWAFIDHGEAKGDDPVESMYARLGKPDADLLMHGTISNLPKLFGLPGTSLYTRGDAAVRLPGTEWNTISTPMGDIPVPNIPTMDTFGRVIKGIGAGIGALAASDDTMGTNTIAEIASNVVTNRPLAGIIETMGTGRAAGTLGPDDEGNWGYDTSFDGQVAAESKTFAEAAYRMLGIRSMGQQQSIQAFYDSKAAEEEQAGRRSVLSGLTRQAIRDGRFDDVPTIFNKYVEDGGSPKYYSRWIKESFESALDDRSARKLKDALNDKTNRSNVVIARILDSQIDSMEDEQSTDDYGREEQIDALINQGWETVPDPMTPQADPLQGADF